MPNQNPKNTDFKSINGNESRVRFPSAASGKSPAFTGFFDSVGRFSAAIYAMQVLQSEMAGETERSGLTTDDDGTALVRELRKEDDNK